MTEIRSYKELSDERKRTKQKIETDFKEKLMVVRQAIEDSFWLNSMITEELLRQYEQTGTKLEGPSTMPPLLYDRNCHYLWASFELISIGMNNPCLATLRPVYEGILHIYIFHLTRREGELLYKEYVGVLTPEEEKEFRGKYKRLSPSTIRRILYSDKTRKWFDKFYGIISAASHATIRELIGDQQYKAEVTEDRLNVLLGLCFSNMLAINEVYFENIFDKRKEEIVPKLENILDEIKAVPNIVPDNPEFSNAIRIKVRLQNGIAVGLTY